jgi:hypothetical protein
MLVRHRQRKRIQVFNDIDGHLSPPAQGSDKPGAMSRNYHASLADESNAIRAPVE